MNQNELKQAVARAAKDYVAQHLPDGALLGVGTGSTANCFIDDIATIKEKIGGCIASSEATRQRLASHGLPVLDLNEAIAQELSLPIYVDGADEIDGRLAMIKGGGGALTREKIVAAAATTFVCICDDSKRVATLGKFPLPIEVIPMAREQVRRELIRLTGGEPRLRHGFVPDNGNEILDLHGLAIDDPVALESQLSQVVGIVCNGLFARRGADVLLLAGAGGVTTHRR